VRAFIPNPAFIKELEMEDETVQAYVDAAEAVAENANELRHQFYREEGAVLVRNESSRVNLNVYVVNVDPGGHMDEWGSVNNEPYAPLRRGVENAGLEFQPTSKK
jgi:hypothetical protein